MASEQILGRLQKQCLKVQKNRPVLQMSITELTQALSILRGDNLWHCFSMIAFHGKRLFSGSVSICSVPYSDQLSFSTSMDRLFTVAALWTNMLFRRLCMANTLNFIDLYVPTRFSIILDYWKCYANDALGCLYGELLKIAKFSSGDLHINGTSSVSRDFCFFGDNDVNSFCQLMGPEIGKLSSGAVKGACLDDVPQQFEKYASKPCISSNSVSNLVVLANRKCMEDVLWSLHKIKCYDLDTFDMMMNTPLNTFQDLFNIELTDMNELENADITMDFLFHETTLKQQQYQIANIFCLLDELEDIVKFSVAQSRKIPVIISDRVDSYDPQPIPVVNTLRSENCWL